MSQHEMRVGDRCLLTTLAVTRWARISPSTGGTDGEGARFGNAGDRPTASANRIYIEHRESEWPIADLSLSCQTADAILDQADVRRGATDIDADDILVSGGLADKPGPDNTRRRARERRMRGHPFDFMISNGANTLATSNRSSSWAT